MPGHVRESLMSMTCAADGHDHWVDECLRGSGGYLGLCGREVMPAALVAPPGPSCAACAAMLNKGYRQQRSRNPGVLAWLKGWAIVRQGKHRRNRAPESVNASFAASAGRAR